MEGLRDACVTLYVHAGIAASDAICAKALGKYAQGDSHADAVKLLASANSEVSKDLDALLKLKTRAGYGHNPVSKEQFTKAKRAAERLVDTAAR